MHTALIHNSIDKFFHIATPTKETASFAIADFCFCFYFADLSENYTQCVSFVKTANKKTAPSN
jgi:hypothetical protein